MEMFCFLVRFRYLDVVSFRTLPAKLIFKFNLGSGCIVPADYVAIELILSIAAATSDAASRLLLFLDCE